MENPAGFRLPLAAAHLIDIHEARKNVSKPSPSHFGCRSGVVGAEDRVSRGKPSSLPSTPASLIYIAFFPFPLGAASAVGQHRGLGCVAIPL